MSKFFIEIGTSDFDTCEELAEKGWNGIFIEPVKELLDNLKPINGCVYENCAVLDRMDTMTIKYYDPAWAEGWVRGVGTLSLDINHMNSNPQWKEHEREAQVPVVTLDYLIDKYEVKHIDYLKIDIEGGEYLILDNYSFKIKPDVMKIEYEHWLTRDIAPRKYIDMLQGMGYTVSKDEHDLLAVLQ